MPEAARTVAIKRRRLMPWDGEGIVFAVEYGGVWLASHRWLEDAEKHAALLQELGEVALGLEFGLTITYRSRRPSGPVVLRFAYRTPTAEIVEQILASRVMGVVA